MGGINDIASALGLPLGGVAVAIALIKAAERTEKEARPEALRDIARVLKQKSWKPAQRPSAIIDHVFQFIFTTRHWSLACFRRSVVGSFLFVAFAGLLYFERTGRNPFTVVNWFYEVESAKNPSLSSASVLIGEIIGLSFTTFYFCIADYISLFKTRLIVKRISLVRNSLFVFLFVMLDVLLSAGLAVGPGVAFSYLYSGGLYSGSGWRGLKFIIDWNINMLLLAATVTEPSGVGALAEFQMVFVSRGFWVWSTLFTSIWTLLVLFAATIIKLIQPIDWLRKLMAWFFPLDEHPVKAIGFVAGGIAMIGSLLIKFI